MCVICDTAKIAHDALRYVVFPPETLVHLGSDDLGAVFAAPFFVAVLVIGGGAARRVADAPGCPRLTQARSGSRKSKLALNDRDGAKRTAGSGRKQTVCFRDGAGHSGRWSRKAGCQPLILSGFSVGELGPVADWRHFRHAAPAKCETARGAQAWELPRCDEHVGPQSLEISAVAGYSL